jgi:hypothetical protein
MRQIDTAETANTPKNPLLNIKFPYLLGLTSDYIIIKYFV